MTAQLMPVAPCVPLFSRMRRTSCAADRARRCSSMPPRARL